MLWSSFHSLLKTYGRSTCSKSIFLLTWLSAYPLYTKSSQIVVKRYPDCNRISRDNPVVAFSWKDEALAAWLSVAPGWRLFPLCKLNFYTRFSLKVWDTQTGCLQFSCQHSSSEYILSCDVSQDDSKLLSGSVDRYAKVNYGLSLYNKLSWNPQLGYHRAKQTVHCSTGTSKNK